ncbi:MAG: hypothetical protein EA342_13330 [Leptolyngbya sp. LCM1.Bin17]|nr:MAG: hypothetical protein EA342_13330 [Leptolyngbya sp. LCM1.Bin17]
MKYIQSLSIGLGLAIISAAIGFSHQANAQTNPVYLTLRQTLVGFFNRDDVEDQSRGRPGTSRGPEGIDEPFCILTPGRNETVWHQQPLFVMEGAVTRLALRQEADLLESSNPEIWSYSPTPTADRLVMTKTAPLEPGDRYEWLFYDTSDDSILYALPFSVMAVGAERDQIAADLAQLEAELTQAGASREAIAQAQADYFLAKDMPADVLHVLFAVAEPSPELSDLRAETVETICGFLLGL